MSLPNAWGKKMAESRKLPHPTDTADVPNMRQIMDEEVARGLQATNDKKTETTSFMHSSVGRTHVNPHVGAHLLHTEESHSRENVEKSEPPSLADDTGGFPLELTADDCSSDSLLAKLLQNQFDREHDEQLSLEERKRNGNEKVQLSFKNFRSTVDAQDFAGVDSSSDDDWQEDEDLKEIRNAKLDGASRAPDFGCSGVIKKSDGGLVTKHDKVVCGRKNADRVMQFPPEFLTGDAIKMDMQLPNSVYNTLKTHVINEEKRLHRILDKKDKATSELALDMNTRIVIYKMINCGILDAVTGTIATGKEAIVLHAKGGTNAEDHVAIPSECALKVYITMLVDFKNRVEYVKEDYRFKNRRKVLKIWAEREFMNLNRMRRAGIRCPSVVKLKKHILVMSFIGQDGIPAPKLKEVHFKDQATMQKAFDECSEAIKKMYTQCSLVHGDFSEFNVLYWQDQCHIIDVAQSMDLSHPKSLIFLARDCYNLVKHFNKIGLQGVPSDRQLFADVTGLLQFSSDEAFYVELQEFVNKNACQDQRREKRSENLDGTSYKKSGKFYDIKTDD